VASVPFKMKRLSLVIGLLLFGTCFADDNSTTPTDKLFAVVQSGNIDAVKALLEKGANPNALKKIGYEQYDTPLISAASVGNVDMVKLLLNKGAKVDIAGDDGETALVCAVACNRSEVVKELIASKANVNVKFKRTLYREPDTLTPLMLAAYRGHYKAAEYLINAKADVSAKSDKGITALHWSAGMGHADVVGLLLDNKANLEEKDSDGRTALYTAAGNGFLEVTKLLLDRKADITARDNIGWTPLMIAARMGRLDVVKFLLEKGADKAINDKEGATALSLAKEHHHEDVVKLLSEGAKP
jgi:ankyrin repeat protein